MMVRERRGVAGCLSLASIIGMLLLATSTATAGTTIGQTFTPPPGAPGSCSTDAIFLQTASPGGQYEAPADGVITSWSFQAPVAVAEVPQLTFKVVRRAGGNDFLVVGQSRLASPVAGALNSYPVQIAVRAGDLIGFHVALAAVTRGCVRPSGTEYGLHSRFGDVGPPGETSTVPPGGTAQLDVAANLETATCRGLAPTVAGTPGRDALSGTPAADVIIGLGGRDRISGLGGNDTICGGEGKDSLNGGPGKDRLLGQQGDDALKGAGGRDTCTGGKGDDSASSCATERSI